MAASNARSSAATELAKKEKCPVACTAEAVRIRTGRPRTAQCVVIRQNGILRNTVIGKSLDLSARGIVVCFLLDDIIFGALLGVESVAQPFFRRVDFADLRSSYSRARIAWLHRRAGHVAKSTAKGGPYLSGMEASWRLEPSPTSWRKRSIGLDQAEGTNFSAQRCRMAPRNCSLSFCICRTSA